MAIKAEKIMTLPVTCEQFCCLAFGLIDKTDFYLFKSENEIKKYPLTLENLEPLLNSPVIKNTGIAKKIPYIKQLKKSLLLEVRSNPNFNPDLKEQKKLKAVPSEKIKKPAPVFKSNDDGSFSYTSSTSIAIKINRFSEQHEFDAENSKWPFFSLLVLSLNELELDYEGMEGWLVDFLGNYNIAEIHDDRMNDKSVAESNDSPQRFIRSQDALDKAMAVMAILLRDTPGGRYQEGNYPNFSRIMNSVIEKLQALEPAGNKDKKFGLSKLDKHLKQLIVEHFDSKST